MGSFTKLGSVLYDILTILISIADVATDIVVLVDFYEKERWVFFWISLSILLLAQCGYSIAFLFRFNTIDGWGCFGTCCAFLCILPFGTLVAFCMYLSDDDFPCFKDFMNGLDLEADIWFLDTNTEQSAFRKWLQRKLQRHFGFVLEAATEAFPQSLLQIIAIVYYQEANYVSIISILLSMTSVITKSLILSKGLEKYTFVWTWLCVVTDFFGIFFTATWVFYAHDVLEAGFLGYFSILGQIWLWKFAVSVLPPVALAATLYVTYGTFAMCGELVNEGVSERQCAWLCFGVCVGPIMLVLATLTVCIAAEVFCFTLVAFFVYSYCTDRFQGRNDKHSVEVIDAIIHFICNGHSSDRILRILALNVSFHQIGGGNVTRLQKYIEPLQKQGYDRLKQVTYYDIRANSNYPKQAHLFPALMREICSPFKDAIEEVTDHYQSTSARFLSLLQLIVYPVFAFILFPTYLMAKLLQACYPWIIMGYLWYFGLYGSVHTFQLVMLLIYMALQMILLLLTIPVCRINYWIWHFVPGSLYLSLEKCTRDETRFINGAQEWCERVVWLPVIEKIVLARFGTDIGTVIIDYVKSIDVDQTTV